jgi:hypothetical protein
MINQVRERLKEIKFLTESIELGKRVKKRKLEYCAYDTIIGEDFTAINIISLYADGIDSFEYLQNLYNHHSGKYPRDWKNDVWGKSLWEEVKTFVKDNDDVEL